ncbi:HlyD family type I secretion periplasmic adaptor subunit [Rhodobacteraceae bacterium RKSG542]|uniref:HlyD family type I secretion periplasmic adaptor subunit n=1 Tax=Pseudovibrio flavus TaxID=2529854 RepID=UPI0012BC1557|nr:HlyD family type I secretion periplasmic adaptor subunit [Pseudovibrio flavus]MTI18579.1 HlyD family type I secretion periplasmic adaptor subunit [Pseudovibrio flavus]
MITLENDRRDKPPVLAGSIIVIIITLIVVGVTWSAFAKLDEVTRGEGSVIPAGRTQIVQASETGNIAEIAVNIGQSVKKGDLLFRLDDTSNSAALGELTARSRALRAQIARLRVEASGDVVESAFKCPEDITEMASQICENELRLFRSKQIALTRQLETLDQRQIQSRSERQEVELNIAGLEASLAIADDEVKMLEPLVKRKIAPRTDLLRVQREIADLNRQKSTATESLFRLESELAELESQKEELKTQEQEDILNELTERIAELSVINESIRAARRKLAQTDTYSPVDGVVNKIEVNTGGAFVTAGTPVLEIVPNGDKLLFEAKINPKDIAFIRPGQPAIVKITAYDFATYGGLDAEVVHVSADAIQDEETGEAYYATIVESDNAFIELNGKEHPLMPGMMGQVDILTGEKTILSYLLEPIITAQNTALRER